jgi:hypothetical protein
VASFDMNLGEDASVGDYYVRAKVGEQVFREKFSVEEFRPATFELKLKSGSENPRPGEQLAFDLDARYLMGSPASGADVEWSLRKRSHVVRFPGFDAYTFSAEPHRWYWYSYESNDDYGELVGDGTGKTNAQGRLSIAARDPATKFEGPIDYILSANVTDSADQTMGKSTVVTAHKTSFYLGMHANEFVQAVNMPFGVNLVAVKPDGSRIGTKAVVRDPDGQHASGRRRRAQLQRRTSTTAGAERDHDRGGRPHTESTFHRADYLIKIEAKDDRKPSSRDRSGSSARARPLDGDEGARMTPSPQAAVRDRRHRAAQAQQPRQATAPITIERDASTRIRSSAGVGGHRDQDRRCVGTERLRRRRLDLRSPRDGRSQSPTVQDGARRAEGLQHAQAARGRRVARARDRASRRPGQRQDQGHARRQAGEGRGRAVRGR